MNAPLRSTGIDPKTGYLDSLVVVKPENETRTNTVAIAQDRDLVVPIQANQTMLWRITLCFYGGAIAAAGNVNSQFTTPAAPANGGWQGHWLDAAVVNQNILVAAVAVAYNNPVNTFMTNAAGSIFVNIFEGYLINGANGGYFSFDWAQNALNANPSTLLKGSRLEARFM